MDDFLKEFFPGIYRRKQQHLQETDYCKYDNQILTLFTSSLYIAALVSTFAASYITRNKGRRASIICGSISFFMGAILNAAAQNIAMLIIGRTLLGFGIGFGNQVSNISNKLQFTAPSKLLALTIHAAGSPVIPLRNGSGENPRSNQSALPTHHMLRDSNCQLRQLRSRKDPSLGMEIVARLSRSSGHSHVRRRNLPSGNSQQPRRTGETRRSKARLGKG